MKQPIPLLLSELLKIKIQDIKEPRVLSDAKVAMIFQVAKFTEINISKLC